MKAKFVFRIYRDLDFVKGPLQDLRITANAEYIQNNPEGVRGQHIDALRRRIAAESPCGCERSNDWSDTDNEEVDCQRILEDDDYSFLEDFDPRSQIHVKLDDIPWSFVANTTYIPWCCTEPYTCYPQHLACLFGQKDLARMLFQKKAADVHARDSQDNTTLMLAAASGSASTMVSLLLLLCQDEDDRKKLVTAQNKDGLTALHFAALSEDPQVVELLVDVGADVNAGQFTTLQNRRFALTPLHFALVRATRPAAVIAKLLVKSGADLSLEAAKANSKAQCVTVVRECSCGLCLCLDIYLCSHLLLPSYGARYDGEIISVGTALHLAVKRSIDLSDLLSEKQHKPLLNIPDGSGHLPLHTAVQNLNEKALKIFLSLGADVNAKVTNNFNNLGSTALHILFDSQFATRKLICICCLSTPQLSNRFKSCVSLLLQQPLVDLNARDWQGGTPLHVALVNRTTVSTSVD
ncbi:serine/threonine-protein phosphatase 6 regulatory ankyrin repeat subunit A-like [Pomacea canaliculata]|uniref:serine/threonine-protein phosphatase 6 regulatory ankyrin repeat subunit A-like n=1 Tax=Pomacea canaliculata TaxID=400727 RepID=UPI000D732217|nr:serine/threonine-protein phosphatase 6 regulatory ankyrin repeat subunit A-like [Pomacea canaliculata]